MTDEELVELYQQGDNTALDELIKRYKRPLFRIINKYHVNRITCFDEDELIQEAYIGIMKAAQKYQFGTLCRVPFFTYAMGAADNCIKVALRIKKIDNAKVSIDQSLDSEEDGNYLVLVQLSEEPFKAIDAEMDRKILRRELEEIMNEVLSPMERTVIKLYYGWENEPISAEAIGRLYNMTQNKVSSIEKKAIKKIRNTCWFDSIAREYFQEKGSGVKTGYEALLLDKLQNKYFNEVI